MIPPNGPRPYQVYPAFTFSAAPTFKKWVHLTATDIQGLRQQPVFQGQNIYFHLNHPIEFVSVVGSVVAVDHIITQYKTRFIILEIDDGSGTTIEAKISYRVSGHSRDTKDTTNNPTDNENKTQPSNTTTNLDNDSESQDTSDGEGEQRSNILSSEPSEQSSNLVLKTQAFQTTTENLTVVSGPGGTDLFLSNPRHRRTKSTRIDIGTVIKAKGTLQRWREAYQLVLRRAFPINSLDEEVQAWSDYSDFVDRVLSKPWVLSEQQITDLKQKQLRDEEEHHRWQICRQEREHAKKLKRVAREAKYTRYERKVERKLAEQARADNLDGNPLDHPGWKPAVIVPPPSNPPVDEPRQPAVSIPSMPAASPRQMPKWQHELNPWQHEITPFQASYQPQ